MPTLTPDVAVALMYLGIFPSIINIYLLWDERRKPGVIWFILSMATAGAWAFLFATFTLIPDPTVTLALANFFWAAVPMQAVAMFLLAYEFVFKQSIERWMVALVFAPIVVLFVASWVNPSQLVFTPEYHVGADGFLQFPNFGGPLKVAVIKVYGYLLAFLGAGMFVGELLRSDGLRRRHTAYLLFTFSILVMSTIVKVAGPVPVYFDPTSVVYSLSGILFAYSIDKHGLMRYIPIARERSFSEIDDAILIHDSDGEIIDINASARRLFGAKIIGHDIESLLPNIESVTEGDARTIELWRDETQRFFSTRTTSITYGRGLDANIVVMSDITELKQRESELDLLKQIFTRLFRHDIRNDVNVITGYAEQIENDPEGDVTRWAGKINDTAVRINDTSQKVREIADVFSYDRTVQGSLRAEVERVVANYRLDSTVAISTDVDDVLVDIHPKFDLAIRELIENAILHQSSTERTEIEIYTEFTGIGVTLVVEDNGPGLPQTEITVLEAETETDLEHSSGIGLWLVRWIAVRSGGELTVDVTGTGTRIGISLPTSTRD